MLRICSDDIVSLLVRPPVRLREALDGILGDDVAELLRVEIGPAEVFVDGDGFGGGASLIVALSADGIG